MLGQRSLLPRNVIGVPEERENGCPRTDLKFVSLTNVLSVIPAFRI